MRESGLRARQKRRFRPRTTESRHSHKIAENWLAKLPAPDRPGQLWQSDITYIETQEGWLYLAFTLDGCSRRRIAHACRGDMLGELTTTTFKHAATRQRPLVGLIHHSDRGSQYAADAFQHCLRAWGVTPSMSRKANPYDNALAESFVATLKTECFADSIPPTEAAAKLMIFDYIETFYNTRRRHSALDYRSPAQFEEDSPCAQRQGCSGWRQQRRRTTCLLLSRSALSRLRREQLCGVVRAAGNNPLQSPKGFQCNSQTINLELANKSPVRVFEERSRCAQMPKASPRNSAR